MTSHFLKNTIKIGKITENIYKKTNSSSQWYKNILSKDTITTLGYGPQGRSQSLNMRDNGLNVIVGCRKSDKENSSWNKAINDGWIPYNNLFEIEEACDKGTIIQNLLSDAGQINTWESVKKYLTENKTLYFSHGFGVVYNNQTGIVPPDNVDVVLVAPKGPGIFVRDNYLNNKHVNASYAIHQNYSNNAFDRTLALGFGIGCDNLFQTTFKKEVHSDLVGERSVLMGAIQGAFKAQYDVLREKGHSPSEAYNETVEEALTTLYPLISDKGMDWMFENCSTTAQRGALDWAPRYYDAVKPVIEQCYQDVVDGKETENVIKANQDSNYREKLNKELDEMKNQEIWEAFRHLRPLRPVE